MENRIVFRNTFFQILSKAVTAGAGFLLAILIARFYGVAGFGQYTQITAFVMLFYLLLDFGFNAIFLQKENRFFDLLSLRFFWAVGVFIIAACAVFVFPFNTLTQIGFSPLVKAGILLYSLSFFAQAIFLCSTAMFQKRKQYRFLWIAQAAGNGATLVVVALGIVLHAPLLFAIAAVLLGSFISALSAFSFARESGRLRVNLTVWKGFITQSWPLGLMLLFNLVYFRVDTVILSVFRTSRDVGIYGLSYQFFDALLTLPLFLSNSLYPVLLEKKNQRSVFFSLSKQYFLIYLIASLVCVLAFWFASPLFTFVRPEFATAIYPFRILLVSLPFFFTTSFLQWILITFKKQRFLMAVYFVSMVVNISLNVFFIPQYGYLAAAAITAVGEVLVFAALLIYVLFLHFAKHD